MDMKMDWTWAQKPHLIMMVGLSGSGKTTKANELAKRFNAKVLSSDDIRQEICGDARDQTKNNLVFETLHNRIFDNLKKWHSVVYDATNLSLKDRTKFFNELKQQIDLYSLEIWAYVMTTPKKICITQNKSRERIVSETVIEKQLKKFEIPFLEEGFDKIIFDNWVEQKVVKCNYFNRLSTLKKMNIEQDTPYHNYTIKKHCLFAKQYAKKNFDYPKYFTEALMFHDIGKLYTKLQNEKGYSSYYSHANVGTYYLLQNLDIFNLNKWEDILRALCLINYHMRPFDWNSEKTRDKYIGVFGIELYNELIDFHEADISSTGVSEERK